MVYQPPSYLSLVEPIKQNNNKTKKTTILALFRTDLKARLVLVENGKRQPTVFPGASHAPPYYLCS